MSKTAFPRFFIYENSVVKEVSENEYHQWIYMNWHPSHLHHSVVNDRMDEVWLGFQGHYKYCEWKGSPFNVTYFVYGNEIQWKEVYDEYYSTYEEAMVRYRELALKGYCSQPAEVLRAA